MTQTKTVMQVPRDSVERLPHWGVRLDALDAELAAAEECHSEASDRHYRYAHRTAGPEVGQPVAAYCGHVLDRRLGRNGVGRDPDYEVDVETARRFAREALEAVERDGLILVPADPNRPSAGLVIRDPRPAAEEAAAAAAVSAVTARRDDFLREHAADLDREQRIAESDAIREAIAGDEPDRLRHALGVGDD